MPKHASRSTTKSPVPPARSGWDRWASLLVGLVFVVCPLLFFTQLTRNPYYTQIALLHVLMAALGGMYLGRSLCQREWRWPVFPFTGPFVAFLLAALVSSAACYIRYTPLQPYFFYEMSRIWVFTLLNLSIPLFLPGLFLFSKEPSNPRLSLWTDILLAFLWAGAWLAFHGRRDGIYGAVLWGAALLYVYCRNRQATLEAFLHQLFAVSVVAAVYGLGQYLGSDPVWNNPVQPYGGRPVSSFGNPNFLSSYLMMSGLLAGALAFDKDQKERVAYGLVAILCASAVLCTLTRSTYVGVGAGVGVLLLLQARARRGRLLGGMVLCAAVFTVVIALFPSSSVNTGQSPWQRFQELFDSLRQGGTYAPWHQRVLIWTSAWDMLHQNRLVGIGWGAFELFYPMFQGKWVLVPLFEPLRTHANNAHNALLEIWAQTGFLGVGAAVWFLATAIIGGWKLWRREHGRPRTIVAGLLSGTVAMIVDNFFGNVSVFFTTPAFLFFWNMGFLFAQSRFFAARAKPMSAAGAGGAVVAMAVLIFLSIYSVRRWAQEIYYFKGFTAIQAGRLPEAQQFLGKAYEWFPGEINSNYEWGNSHSRQAAEFQRQNRIDDMRAAQEKAAAGYAAALRANPGYDEIYFNLGVTQNQLGKPDDAEKNFRMAIFINPLFREGYTNLANVYLKRGDFASALRVLKTAVGVFPPDRDLWNNMGYCYTQRQQWKEAFDAFRQSILLSPDFTDAARNMVTLVFQQKKDPHPYVAVLEQWRARPTDPTLRKTIESWQPFQ